MMLEIDSRAEQDTIKNYVERIIQTQSAGEFGLEKKEYYHTGAGDTS